MAIAFVLNQEFNFKLITEKGDLVKPAGAMVRTGG